MNSLAPVIFGINLVNGMLQFFTTGERDFSKQALEPARRLNWEFYAVIEGECAPWLEGPPPANSKTTGPVMWLFPPYFIHGWTGRDDVKSKVVCLHYLSVPQQLKDQVLKSKKGYLMVELSKNEIGMIRHLAEETGREYQSPTTISLLVFEKALLALSLVFLKRGIREEVATLHHDRETKIWNAVEHFKSNLHRGIKVSDIARLSNVSTSYLRQLFHEEIGLSPKQCFEQIRLKKAAELMSNTNQTLDVIASTCGYNVGTELSRAFKRHFNISPDAWRRSHLPDPEDKEFAGEVDSPMPFDRHFQTKVDKYFETVEKGLAHRQRKLTKTE